jgi:hypothetical protein
LKDTYDTPGPAIINCRGRRSGHKNANSRVTEQSFQDIFEHIEKRVSCNLIVNYTIAYDILKH